MRALDDLLKGMAKPVFGLKAQGYIPTVERMLAAGASWDEIGKAIGWSLRRPNNTGGITWKTKLSRTIRREQKTMAGERSVVGPEWEYVLVEEYSTDHPLVQIACSERLAGSPDDVERQYAEMVRCGEIRLVNGATDRYELTEAGQCALSKLF